MAGFLSIMHISQGRLRALKISAFAIASVAIVEFASGMLAGSLAIISDSAHAMLDAISTFILLYATKASTKPSDEEHMYGHEKFESLGGLVGGIVLFGTALYLVVRALQKILTGELFIVKEWEVIGFAAIAYTFCVDILRLRVLYAVKEESVTAKAGFYHSFADLGSTFVAFFGFGMASLGFLMFDVLASLVLSTAIGYLSVKLVRASGLELSDAAPKGILEKVRGEIAATEGVSKIAGLRVRKAGAKTFVEAIIAVPDYMSLEEAHTVASKVEENLKRLLGSAEVVVHVEPPEKEMLTTKLVEQLAGRVEGVKEVHEVSVVHSNGRLYLTLHARVDPELSLQEAHELAEKIEQAIAQEIKNVENVTVHVEPFDSSTQRGPIVDEEEIRQIIFKTARSLRRFISVKRIITYVAGGRRYVNIDCCFTEQVNVKKAHEIASKIERAIEQKFSETVVTVHVEPQM
ncbi:MAG: cation-efflux pump [Candidatus Bathyarchaeia archaeon]